MKKLNDEAISGQVRARPGSKGINAGPQPQPCVYAGISWSLRSSCPNFGSAWGFSIF